MGNKGKSGCGCFVFLVVVCLICIGALAHPVSLKFIAGQLRYEDKIVPADVVFVHRFAEDKNGELYTEAFRQYWAGNAKLIYIEEDKLFGVSMQDIISRTAKTKGIKEDVVKTFALPEGDEIIKARAAMGKLEAKGYRKVIVLVPDYASGRFHSLYGSKEEKEKTLYMIKPVEVSYFKKDNWWKTSLPRIILIKELYNRGADYFSAFKN